jgi:hypothetical protein
MSKKDMDDIDYENLDDLPLLDHIEWNHCITEEAASDDINQFELLWAVPG